MILFRILQGWFYFFFRNKNVEQIAKKRITICLSCSHSKFFNWRNQWEHNELGKPKTSNNIYCSKCWNCPISKKVRSPKEKCPLGRW